MTLLRVLAVGLSYDAANSCLPFELPIANAQRSLEDRPAGGWESRGGGSPHAHLDAAGWTSKWSAWRQSVWEWLDDHLFDEAPAWLKVRLGKFTPVAQTMLDSHNHVLYLAPNDFHATTST